MCVCVCVCVCCSRFFVWLFVVFVVVFGQHRVLLYAEPKPWHIEWRILSPDSEYFLRNFNNRFTGTILTTPVREPTQYAVTARARTPLRSRRPAERGLTPKRG